MFPDCVNELIENFKKLPGIGQKTAERMAFSILSDFDSDDYDEFSNSLISVRDNIGSCKVCNSITEGDLCFVCADKSRDSSVLMVVENSKEVFLLERMGNFNGYYHVLGGLISPFDDVGPDDINLSSLFDRINNPYECSFKYHKKPDNIMT